MERKGDKKKRIQENKSEEETKTEVDLEELPQTSFASQSTTINNIAICVDSNRRIFNEKKLYFLGSCADRAVFCIQHCRIRTHIFTG